MVGHHNRLNACLCSVGYIGKDCFVTDMNRVVPESLIASVPTTTTALPLKYTNGICISNSSIPTLKGFYLCDDTYEGIAFYHSFDNNIIIHCHIEHLVLH